MIWPALLKTIGICLVSVVIEAISATKDGIEWFGGLKRPKFSFPMKVWYLVGAIYYILFGIATYRQFTFSKPFLSLPVILLIFIMIVNGLSNFILFKYRSLKWFYLIIYPFFLILLALVIVLWKEDKLSAGLVSLYLLWLFYDLYFGYNIWKMNTE